MVHNAITTPDSVRTLQLGLCRSLVLDLGISSGSTDNTFLHRQRDKLSFFSIESTFDDASAVSDSWRSDDMQQPV